MNAHSACGGAGVVSAVIVAVSEGIHYSQQLKVEYTEITRTTGKMKVRQPEDQVRACLLF